MPDSNKEVETTVTIGRNQVVQAVRDMINDNEDFDHRYWSMYDVETLENAARLIREGYDKACLGSRKPMNDIQPRHAVRTAAELGSTIGILVSQHYLDARKPDEVGIARDYVPGHGGDVWWVEHEDGTIGVYTVSELTEVKP